MNFEERLRAALEDKVYKELETSELKGIQKAYLAIDNRIIQLARETDHFKLYIKNNYDIIIKYRLDNGKVETEALYISDLDTELEKDHMDGSRLMYYIYSNHEYDKGIKISQYEETNDGDKVYPGLEIEFVRKEVAKPLKDRILEIRKCVSLVEDKNTAWRKSIAASVLDLVENLNDEILKLAATGEHQAEIYMAGNSIFITKTRTEENPSLGEIKSYGLQIKIPKDFPSKTIKTLGRSEENLIAEEVQNTLVKYYKEEENIVAEPGKFDLFDHKENRYYIKLSI